MSEKDALDILRRQQLTPLEPYPGGCSAEWDVQCDLCGAATRVIVKVVAQRKYPGCADCGRRQRIQVHTLTETEAIGRAQAANLTPVEPYPENSKAPWRCRCNDCGHEMSPQVRNLPDNAGCRPCADRRRRTQTRSPSKPRGPTAEQALQLLDATSLDPLEPYPGKTKVPWLTRCRVCGATARRSLEAYRRTKGGCSPCNLQRQYDSYRLPQEEAIRSAREGGFEALEPYPGGGRPWRCRCMTCGKESTAWLGNIRQGSGCIYCARKRIDPEDAVERMRERGFEPLEPYPGANKRWLCLCVEGGHQVHTRYTQIVTSGYGCVVCAGQVRDVEEATRVMRDSGLEPLVEYPGANRGWLSRCLTCGKETSPTYSHISRGTGGCKWCSRRVVDPEFAVEAMIRAGVKPLVPYTSAKTPWKSECLKCGRIVKPTWTHIAGGRGGCRYCMDFGFRAHRPSVVYVAEHHQLGAVKIGIANTDTNNPRLDQHTRRGWDIVGAIAVDGDTALWVEREVLDWWRTDLGLPHFLSAEEMPQGGFSETVSAEAIQAIDVWMRVQELAPKGIITPEPLP